MLFLNSVIIFVSLSFFIYGATCIWKPYMKDEFNRYGLARFRVLVGSLQLIGAFGLLLGLKWTGWLVVASGGLGVLMLLGFIVRLKIHDGLWLSLPAFSYMALCFYIFRSYFL
ncbi:MAG: hypothetical protein HQ462_08245 [Deltaproteobacteria bacterium]|nr:hypothetical protein [Deltaproteobacteria bacterium]